MAAPNENPNRRIRRARRPHPRAATAVQLFVFENEHFVGTEVFGVRDAVVIGRHPSADLRLDADTVSREHARLWVEDGAVRVRDLGSGNGLFIDRRRIHGAAELGPRDALQIGPYTLRARALEPTPPCPYDVERAEAETRLEAILGSENTGGTRELPVDLDDGTPHLRLIEAALARSSGTSEAAPPPGSRFEAALARSSGTSEAAPPPGSRASPEPLTPSPVVRREDAGIERRVRDLDAILAGLEERRPSLVPWRESRTPPLDTDEYRRDLASPLAMEGRVLPPPAPEAPAAAEAELPREHLLFEPPLLSPDEEDTEAELEDEPRSSRGEPSPKRPIRDPATNASTEAEVGPGAPSVEAPVGVEVGPSAPSVEAPVRAELEDGPTEAPRPLSLRLVPSAPAFDAPTRTAVDPPEARRGAPARRSPEPGVTPSAPLEARLVTPSDLGITVQPVHRRERAEPAPRASIPRERAAPVFDAIEVVATRGGQVLDIAVLRRGGQQYVLGHPTPQGKLAPFARHEGLRLVRLHADTSADLVFPRDVRGFLRRQAEQVRLQDLTEGRKYSCLRLELGDAAEVVLGEGARAITYRLAFRTRPSTIFGRRDRSRS